MEIQKVPQSYFDEIVRLMIQAGYVLISRVEISSDDFRFNLAGTYAKVTSLFFHERRGGLIVQMALEENNYYLRHEDRYYTGWSVKMYGHQRPYQECLPMLVVDPDSWHAWGDDRFKRIPFFHEEVEISGLTENGGWSDEGIRKRDFSEMHPRVPMEAKVLVEAVTRALGPVLPFVKPGSFPELQVTDFPPHYVFRGCIGEFWRRFDRKYFRNVVHRPWGSDSTDDFVTVGRSAL